MRSPRVAFLLSVAACAGAGSEEPPGFDRRPLREILEISQRVALDPPGYSELFVRAIETYNTTFAPRLVVAVESPSLVVTCGSRSAAAPASLGTGDSFCDSVEELSGVLSSCLESSRLGTLGSFQEALAEATLRAIGGRSHFVTGRPIGKTTSGVEEKLDESRLIERVGYIRLGRFREGTAAQLRRWTAALQNGGARGLAIDLRGNPGGLLSEVLDGIGVFVPKEAPILRVRERNRTLEYRSEGRGTSSPLPIAVLVDRETGAGAELMAVVLRELRRAIVIGERTAGQGTIETVFPLSDGTGAAITTGIMFGPNDTSFAANGLEPAVRTDASTSTAAGDPTLAAAIRRLQGSAL